MVRWSGFVADTFVRRSWRSRCARLLRARAVPRLLRSLLLHCRGYSQVSLNDARRLLRPCSAARALSALDGMPLHRRTCCTSVHELSHLRRLRSLLTAVCEKLAVEKERADSLAGEHFKLSQELRRALDREAAERRATAAKLSSAGAALASDHAASFRRLEALR
jgi:hypothetical protein